MRNTFYHNPNQQKYSFPMNSIFRPSILFFASFNLLSASPFTKDVESKLCTVWKSDDSAHLQVASQKLAGEVTRGGLVLRTSDSTSDSDFQVKAVALGRGVTEQLARSGNVSIDDSVIKYARPLVTEEYRVGMDGVRQDFLVHERPEGRGDLRVGLSVDGASVLICKSFVKLTLDQSGRELVYQKLKVTDATGRELPARFEVGLESDLEIQVDDSTATYPIRIDPTFTDADWIAMGGAVGIPNALLINIKSCQACLISIPTNP